MSTADSTRAVALTLLALAAYGGEKKDEAKHPRFVGSWALNVELSDDTQAKLKEAMGERRRGGRFGGPTGSGPMGGGPMGGGPMSGGPVGGPMGGPGMGGAMAAPPDRQEMERLRAAMDDAVRAAETLLVSQEGVAFEIVRDGEHIERLYADGRKNKGATGIERRTRWADDELVTEAKLGGGFGPAVKITETWSLVESDPGPESAPRLSVVTRLEGGPFEKGVVLKRLYDAAPTPGQ